MLQKLPRVQLTAVENNERWGSHRQIDLCIINGNVFILLSGFVDYKTPNVMRKHLDEGEITAKDMFPVVGIGKRSGPVWIASAKVVLHYEKEIIALVRYGNANVYQDQIAFAASWLERNADGGGLNAYTMSDEEIDNAHFTSVAGTIAGDDTILVVGKDGFEKAALISDLSEIVPAVNAGGE